MTTSKNSFLDHVKWFRKGVNAASGEAIVALDTWIAFIRQGKKHLELFPQFDATIQGSPQYQEVMTDQAAMFAGWLPYRRKRWDIASDKLAFKSYAKEFGLNVPEYWSNAELSTSNVVVKRPRSSFGQQVFGPYRSAEEHPLDIENGEYYEKFVEGSLLKIWFWDENPICAEMDNMPSVRGDGVSTLAEMILQRARQYRPVGEAERSKIFARAEILLRYFERELKTVLKRVERQIIEFRYGTILMHWSERLVLDFAKDDAPPWLPQLRTIGTILFSAIPAAIRQHTLFTVDAVVGKDGQIWLLEMNSNPTVHPLVYPTMVEKLLGTSAINRKKAISANVRIPEQM